MRRYIEGMKPPAANDDEPTEEENVALHDYTRRPFDYEDWDDWPQVDPKKFTAWYLGFYGRREGKHSRIYAALSEYCVAAKRRPPPRASMFNVLHTSGWCKVRKLVGEKPNERKLTLYRPPPESR